MAELPFPESRLLVDASRVRLAWDQLAAGIQPHIDRGPCLLLGVLLGGMVPMVQVSQRLRGDFLMDYCYLSRYRGSTRGGALRWIQQPRLPMAGHTVILVDDIFDEGYTLEELRRHCASAGAVNVLAAVLLRKRHQRPVAGSPPEYVGLEVGDHYVFGCGMDYQDRWRHLDAIYALLSSTGRSSGTDGCR